LVRTNTLVKGSIIQIEPTPFREIFKKKSDPKTSLKAGVFNLTAPQKEQNLLTSNDMISGKLLARICSRPGQTGRVDGYVLEGIELEFYLKKIQKKHQ